MKKIRKWFIKQGLFKPKTLQETRDIFPFPNATQKSKPLHSNIGLSRHMEDASSYRRYNNE